jgi:hypothetical protein
MLAGLGVELRLVADGAAGALQEQVGAFTAGEFGLGAEVTCHFYFPSNDYRGLLPREPAAMAAGGGLKKTKGHGLRPQTVFSS